MRCGALRHCTALRVVLRFVKAKFHYTDPTGPARTLSETRTDPTEFLGDPGRKKVRAGPVGSGRARIVEFSYKPAHVSMYAT